MLLLLRHSILQKTVLLSFEVSQLLLLLLLLLCEWGNLL